MHRCIRIKTIAVLLVLLPCFVRAESRPDLLSFSAGALPVAIHVDAGLKMGMDQALKVIDGDLRGFVLTLKPAVDETVIEIIYQLPALTRFDAFSIPEVLETPSPSQTFVRDVVIAGSTQSADGPWTELAMMSLQAHAARGELSSISIPLSAPVRWLRLRLRGGLDVQRDKMFLEFSELIAHGEQEPVPMVEHFNGQWQGRGVLFELHQRGSMVTGCYDRRGDLTGSVDGNMLLASGSSRSGDIPSSFVLMLDDAGDITGVASTNGAPFRRLQGKRATGLDSGCAVPSAALPGCGSVLHSIGFGYDSAELRDDARLVLDELYAGLQQSPAAEVTIVGHTSSEGDAEYNQSLSQHRAEAVVSALAERGIAAQRLTASGVGEAQPMADNSTAAGRSLNRRVEVQCLIR